MKKVNYVIAFWTLSMQSWSVYTMEQHKKLDDALVKAARCNERDAVSNLLKKGANPNTVDRFGNTPLHYAAQSSVATVEVLLEAGADVEAASPKRRVTALHMALWASNMKTAVRLIEAGADISCRDAEGTTPLTQKPRNPLLAVQREELIKACLAAISLQEIHAKLIEGKLTRAYDHFGEQGIDPNQLITLIQESMLRTLQREQNKKKVPLKKPASCTQTCTRFLSKVWHRFTRCFSKDKEA